tara:strand:- start:1051 stop:1308 length:258 start_codon:yes stop_codon:yes gene_type:complete
MPFKSDKQRRYLYANNPRLAEEFESKAHGGEVVTPGMMKASIKNSMKDMREFSANRAKGRIGNGSRMPHKCVDNQELAMKKFKEN